MKKISSACKSKLGASTILNNFRTLIEELVYNSLDAKSTSIAIRVSFEDGKVQVIDNGHGISKEDFRLLGKSGTTSKCFDGVSLKSAPKTYGCRGQSLASIVIVSEKVAITSRCADTDQTWTKIFIKGKELQINDTNTRASKGTTVEINGFLYNRAIQKQAVNPLHDIEDIKAFLQLLSLVHTNVSISLRDDSVNEIVFKVHKKRDIYQTLSTLYGINKTDVQELQVEKHCYKVKGYIAKNNTNNVKCVYLNRRFVPNRKLHKIIEDNLSKSLALKNKSKIMKTKNKNHDQDENIILQTMPSYIIFITCPYNDYDISNTPKKHFLEFRNWDNIRKLLEKLINFYVGDVNIKQVPCLNLKDNENLQNIDSRNEVKKIIDKILGNNAKKLGVSIMQKGVKGQLIKRNKKKNMASKMASPPKALKVNRNLEPVDLKIPHQSHFTANNAFYPQNITKHMVPQSCENFPDANLNQAPKLSRKVRDTVNINVNGTFSARKKRRKDHNRKKKKQTKDLAELFEEGSDTIKRNCEDLTKKAEQVLYNKIETVDTNDDKNHQKNDNPDNKRISTRHLMNEKILNENNMQINIQHFQETTNKEDSIKLVPKTTYDLLQPLSKIKPSTEEEEVLGKKLKESLKERVFKPHLLKNTKAKTINQNILQGKHKIENAPNYLKKFKSYNECYGFQNDYPEYNICSRLSNTYASHQNVKSIETRNTHLQSLTFDSHCHNGYRHASNCFEANYNEKDCYFVSTCLRDCLEKKEPLKAKCRKSRKHSFIPYSKKKTVIENFKLHVDTNSYDIEFSQSCQKNLHHAYIISSPDKDVPKTNVKATDREIRSFMRHQLVEEALIKDNSSIQCSPLLYAASSSITQNIKNYKNLDVHSNQQTINEESSQMPGTYTVNRNNASKSRTYTYDSEHVQSLVCYENKVEYNSNVSKNINLDVASSSITQNIKNYKNLDVHSNQQTINEESSQMPGTCTVNRNNASKSRTYTNDSEHIQSLVCYENKVEYNSNVSKNINLEINSENEIYIDNDDINLNNDKNLNVIFVSESREADVFTKNSLDPANYCETVLNNSCDKKNYHTKENFDDSLINYDNYSDTNNEHNIFNKETQNNNKDNIDTHQNVQKNNEDYEYMEISEYFNESFKVLNSSKVTENCNGLKILNNKEKEMHLNITTNFESRADNSESNFNFKNRLRFLPKGMSQIFDNCNTKNACEYNMEQDYYEDDIYNNFVKDIQTNTDILGPDIQNVRDAATKHIEKGTTKLCKDNASLVFDGQSLNHAVVLGQVDDKFIAAKMKGHCKESGETAEYLVLFDQHAVHERIRLENNLSDYFNGNAWKTKRLDSFSMKISDEESVYLHNYKEKFEQFGLLWSTMDGGVLCIEGIPEAILGKYQRQVDIVMKAVKSLIKEEIQTIKYQRGCILLQPKSIMNLVFSEACRYAIKFGDKLSTSRCSELIQSLSECKTPFQCAHGRPVMAVLLDVQKEERTYKVNMDKLKKF